MGPVADIQRTGLSGTTKEERRIVDFNQAATIVADEAETAVQTARRDLPSLPPPVTRLAVLHTGPILLDVPPPAQPSE